ncbi:retinochrome-like [Babylonia areolata]|uniref:retinochrome-like n=1 Tax=Babylonia areolata TaxID=304850 RepID=UPI003FD4E9E2
MASEEVIMQAGRGVAGVAEFSRFEHVTVGVLYMVFGITGVVTNILLILTFLKDKALFRGSSAWLHISLGVANVAVVAPAPFPASSSFSGKWLYGDKMCQAYAFEGMFVGIAAIGSIISLCLERYVVSSRKETMQQSSSTFYWLVTGLNLANAFFWAVMPILGWSRYSLDHTGTSCAIDWKNADEGYLSYMAMLCTFSFGLPMLAALLALYKSLPDATAEPRAAASAPTSSASGSGGQDAATSSFTEAQLRGLCLTFLGLVVVGWGPFAALCVWAMVADTAGASMLAACLPPLACKCCTALYPLAYMAANGRFKAGYLSLLGASSHPAAGDKAE